MADKEIKTVKIRIFESVFYNGERIKYGTVLELDGEQFKSFAKVKHEVIETAKVKVLK